MIIAPQREFSIILHELAPHFYVLWVEMGRPLSKLPIDAVNEYLSRNGKSLVA